MAAENLRIHSLTYNEQTGNVDLVIDSGDVKSFCARSDVHGDKKI